MRYERYDKEKEKYLRVKLNEGGGSRFIECEGNEPITFGEIRERAIDLFFDNGRNFFNETPDECIIGILDASGENMHWDSDLWTFLESKGLFLSRINFILRSKEKSLFFEDSDIEGEDSQEPKICPACKTEVTCKL